MKYRVERSRLDHGYGAGWVILDPAGEVVGGGSTQPAAFLWALDLAVGAAL